MTGKVRAVKTELKRKRVTQQNVVDGEVDADVLFASAAKMYKGLKEQNAGLKGELEGVRKELAALRKEKDELFSETVALKTTVRFLQRASEKTQPYEECERNLERERSLNAILRDKLFRYELGGPPSEFVDLT